MNKNKYKKSLIVSIIVVFVLMYGFLPPLPRANAVDSISSASDTITDSDIGQIANHDIDFTTGTTTPNGGRIEVVFPSAPQTFGNIVDFDCPDGVNWASSTDNTTATCDATSERASGTKQIMIYSLTNATSSGVQYITINHYSDAGVTLLERVKIAVFIISDVLMTARVDSSLSFVVSGTSTGAVVNNANCTEDSTSTTTPFGDLEPNTPQTVCQELSVTTNATNGYTVTVEQDQEMISDGGANINSFNNSPNGTGTSTPEAWTSPTNVLDQYHTYGHMGLTSEDSTLSWGGGDPFGNAFYAGFTATTPIEVMYHTGPADGSTDHKGLTRVAYTAEIGSLQEAGDYENTLTYICTPTF